MLDGLFGGHVANHSRDWSNEWIRIYAGVDEEAAAKHWTLFKGAIDGEGGSWNDVFIVNIGGDANDAVRRGAKAGDEFQHRIRPENMAIEGILIGEHASGERFADDDDAHLRARILFAGGTDVTVCRELQAGTESAGIPPGSNHAESGLGHAW